MRWEYKHHARLPVSVTRQTRSPNSVCRLTPIDRVRTFTPPVGQSSAGWQLHTLMVKVLVLERAGEPLSVTTTGRRYWVRSLRVKVLLRATMPAVLSKNEVRRDAFFFFFGILQTKQKKAPSPLRMLISWKGRDWITGKRTQVMWFKIQSKLCETLCLISFPVCAKVNLENSVLASPVRLNQGT